MSGGEPADCSAMLISVWNKVDGERAVAPPIVAGGAGAASRGGGAQPLRPVARRVRPPRPAGLRGRAGLPAGDRQGRARELVVEPDRRLHPVDEVAEVQALVLGVDGRVRVLDAHQQARHAAERVGERLNEADRAAGADHGRLAPVGVGQRAARRLERGALGVGRPPLRRARDLRGDARAGGGLFVRRRTRSRPASAASMSGTVRIESRARAASRTWFEEPSSGCASSAITVSDGRVHSRSHTE